MNRAKEMKFIRISINEFKALLNRLCESYYGHKYDFEDTAAIIQWLELHDLMGIIKFLDITNVNPKKINIMPILLEDLKTRFVFHNHDHSLIHTMSIITDMALAKCHQDNSCHASIINILHPIAILPSLIKCSRHGYHSKAWWTDSENNLLHLASINPNEAYPNYSTIKINNSILNNKPELDLICSKDRINSIESYINIQPLSQKEKVVQETLADEFKKRLNDKILNGLYIETDHYERLSQIADQILVEASEQSRLGAGE
jgi:hypothetical protein